MLEPRTIRLMVLVVIMLTVGGMLGVWVYPRLNGDAAAVFAERQSLAQIQEQLTGIEKRLGTLESHRKGEVVKATPDVKTPETPVPSQATAKTTPRAPQAQIQVTQTFVHHTQPVAAAAQPAVPDPASTQKIASLEQGVGTLREETGSTREALQANTNRLAEVAGELGAQNGRILKNQNELNQFLERTQHTAVTFELRRGLDPESVGPVRISLKTSNQKSQRYTICVYVKNSCVQMRDRVIYEVVQLAVSRDTGPLELIATKVDKDGIAGYLEVPRESTGH